MGTDVGGAVGAEVGETDGDAVEGVEVVGVGVGRDG